MSPNMMYVLEYLVYHLKPYGYDTVIKQECSASQKKGDNLESSVTEKPVEDTSTKPKPEGNSDGTGKGKQNNSNEKDEGSERKRSVHARIDIEDDEEDDDFEIDEDRQIEEENLDIDIIEKKEKTITVKLDVDENDRFTKYSDKQVLERNKISSDSTSRNPEKDHSLLKMVLQGDSNIGS